MSYKTRKITLLLLIAAAGNSAMAQTEVALESGFPYTFTSISPASGTGSITYQWYRDDVSIAGATSEAYNLPASLTYGGSVRFRREAKTSSCNSYSNTYVVSFYTVLSGTAWATTNVIGNGVLAPKADVLTSHFQWNRLAAWPPTGNASNWNATDDPSATWTNNPCPAGWRLPTQPEVAVLYNLGSTWADANSARGNAVAGRFFGPNHATCRLPSNMSGCIFLSAAMNRYPTNGVVDNTQGNIGAYWTGTQSTSTIAYIYTFGTAGASPSVLGLKAGGYNIRCVRP